MQCPLRSAGDRVHSGDQGGGAKTGRGARSGAYLWTTRKGKVVRGGVSRLPSPLALALCARRPPRERKSFRVHARSPPISSARLRPLHTTHTHTRAHALLTCTAVALARCDGALSGRSLRSRPPHAFTFCIPSSRPTQAPPPPYGTLPPPPGPPHSAPGVVWCVEKRESVRPRWSNKAQRNVDGARPPSLPSHTTHQQLTLPSHPSPHTGRRPPPSPAPPSLLMTATQRQARAAAAAVSQRAGPPTRCPPPPPPPPPPRPPPRRARRASRPGRRRLWRGRWVEGGLAGPRRRARRARPGGLPPNSPSISGRRPRPPARRARGPAAPPGAARRGGRQRK